MGHLLNLLAGLFEFLSLNNPPDIFPYIAIIVFVWSVIKFTMIAYNIRNELIRALDATVNYKRNEGENPAVVQKITDDLNGLEISQYWAEFKESMVFTSEGDVRKYRNTLDSQHFFNIESICKKLDFYSTVPGLLTGIAILGTFVGIIYGLRDSNIAEAIANSSDTKQFAEAIGKFLNGLGSAFGASVWGLGFSLAFTSFERLISSKIELQLSQLNRKLNFVFHRQTAEELLIRIHEENQNQLIALQSISNDLPVKLVSALTDGAVNSVEIGEGLKRGIQTGFEGLSLRIEALNEFHDKYFSETNILFENIKVAAESISSATKANEVVLSNVSIAGESIKVVGETIERAKSVSSELLSIVKTQEASIESAGKNLQAISTSFDNVIGVMSGATSEMPSGVKSSASELKKSSEELVPIVANATEGLKSGFKSIDELMGSAVTNLGSAIGGMNKHLELLVEKVGDVVDRVETKVGRQELSQMNSSIQEKFEKVEGELKKIGS